MMLLDLADRPSSYSRFKAAIWIWTGSHAAEKSDTIQTTQKKVCTG